ncbi:MAG: acyl-CoA dehydrogenase family protein [Rhodococcus sp. (in: high G+C Gram-positive bacteria)]|uniref:acyl-CoA dehydrogenase family protein n=1 Tax=Rhodococcus sp. TaxID=1831 RepID=UPI003BB011AB
MDSDLSAELNQYRDAVRGCLAAKTPDLAAHPDTDSGLELDRRLWQQMAKELGATGLLVPEDSDGQESPYFVASLVLEELGRALVRVPYLTGAVLAPAALAATGAPDACADYLAGISSGDLIATVAFSEGVTGRPGESTVHASRSGDAWTLSGTVALVLEAQSADLLLVVARTDHGLGLFAVPTDSTGLEQFPLRTLDLTRSCSRVVFRETPAVRLGEDFTDGQHRVLSIAAVAISAELAGAAQRATEMAVEYASVRSQFGILIGSTQAVQRLCVDMFRTSESAIAISRAAARDVGEDQSAATRIAHVAKAYCSAHCPPVGETNIQVHGGIGFTWEHPAHYYLRRLRAGAQLFGDAAHHREQLGLDLGLSYPDGRLTRGTTLGTSTEGMTGVEFSE